MQQPDNNNNEKKTSHLHGARSNAYCINQMKEKNAESRLDLCRWRNAHAGEVAKT